MGIVTVDFIGLHLIDNRVAGEKKIAVIHADQHVVKVCAGRVTLDRHQARLTISRGAVASATWPAHPDFPHAFELKGNIEFSEGGGVDDRRVKTLKVKNECANFTMPDDFFEKVDAHDKGRHALITLAGGRLSPIKIRGGEAIHTRATFVNPRSFTITRTDDGKYIELMPSANAAIRFLNTELTSRNDDDWLWYMHATKNACCGKPNPDEVPDEVEVIELGHPVGVLPLTIGCSNSNWP